MIDDDDDDDDDVLDDDGAAGPGDTAALAAELGPWWAPPPGVDLGLTAHLDEHGAPRIVERRFTVTEDHAGQLFAGRYLMRDRIGRGRRGVGDLCSLSLPVKFFLAGFFLNLLGTRLASCTHGESRDSIHSGDFRRKQLPFGSLPVPFRKPAPKSRALARLPEAGGAGVARREAGSTPILFSRQAPFRSEVFAPGAGRPKPPSRRSEG